MRRRSRQNDPISVRARQLAALIAAAIGVDSGAAHAIGQPAVAHNVTRVVSSCADDGGSTTLRSVIAGAGNGDLIDMSALTCSGISLQDGQIAINVHDLILQGPGADKLTIHAGGTPARVFATSLSVTGTLRLFDMTIADGDVAYQGGCLFAASSVNLTRVTVANCHADTFGGGLVVGGDLLMYNSTLRGNSVASVAPSFQGLGGGAMVSGHLTAKYSTVADNTAALSGGGLFVVGNTTIVGSTLSGNTASKAGGLLVGNVNSTYTSTSITVITNSTISGNTGHDGYGGGFISGTSLTMSNSTVAFNLDITGGERAAGLTVVAGAVVLDSSIIANNTKMGAESDLDAPTHISLTGTDNLVMQASTSLPMPGITIAADPQLLPLGGNGGGTLTHALARTSPAIDTGNIQSGASVDQRGLPRIAGAAADIGAYELQPDLLFADSFE